MNKFVTQKLPAERSRYMQKAAGQAYQMLAQFAGGPVGTGQEAVQLLDEWIDRMQEKAPLPPAVRVMVIAFLGQAFLGRHGGYWAVQVKKGSKKPTIGIVCPLAMSKGTRFIDIADQVNRRLSQGIAESLAFFYLTTGMELATE